MPLQAADSLGVLQLQRQEYTEALHSLDIALAIETPLAELPEVRSLCVLSLIDMMALCEPVRALLSSMIDACHSRPARSLPVPDARAFSLPCFYRLDGAIFTTV